MKAMVFLWRYIVYVAIVAAIVSCKKEGTDDTRVPLKINNYYPNSGKGGTLVNIIGEGFSTSFEDNVVTFGGRQAEVVSAKEDVIVVRTPEGIDNVLISLSSRGSSIDVGNFIYQSLSVHGLSPSRAQEGSQIRVIGEGFASLAGPAVVTINEMVVNVVDAKDTVLFVEVPIGAGRGPVVVKVDGMEATGPEFISMSISHISPATGGAGTRVTIHGEGFFPSLDRNVVTFDGKAAEIIEVSESHIVAIAPQEVSSGRILLTSDGGTVVGPDFIVVPPPVISNVSPLSGPAGTEMVIIGEHFSAVQGETRVLINNLEMTLSSVSDEEIKLTIPASTGSGIVKVIVNDQVTDGPEFKEQDLGIISMFPDNGLSGTEVTILGTGFSANLSENQVTFNGIPATVLASSETTITVSAPQGLSTGPVRVRVGDADAPSPYDFLRAGVFTLAATGLNVASDGGAIAVDDDENVYVIEVDNHRIVKVTPTGQVSTFAGSGSAGHQDGQGAAASFRLDIYSGIVFDSHTQHLFVSDAGNQSLRRINLNGEVSTAVPDFGSPIGKMGVRNNGQIYVLRSAIENMWVVSPASGTVTSISGGYTALGSRNVKPAINAIGNIYNRYNALSTNGNRVNAYTSVTTTSHTRIIAYAGTTAAGYVDGIGAAARFNNHRGMTDLDGESFVLIDANNYAIRKVNTSTAEVSTIVKGENGFQDGDFRNVRFSNAVWDITVNRDGSAIYLLDCGNNAVRKVYLR